MSLWFELWVFWGRLEFRLVQSWVRVWIIGDKIEYPTLLVVILFLSLCLSPTQC